MPITPDQVRLLKTERLFRDMLRTEGWSEYQKILRDMVEMRTAAILQPLHMASSDQVPGGDFVARSAALESMKGALIGLKLALDLPSTILSEADEIRKRHNEDIADE